MRHAVGILMGLFSGFLIYLMIALLVVDTSSSSGPSPALVLVTFVGGCVASSWLLIRGAKSTAMVFRRGFLLGAAEWLAMGLVVIVFSGKAVGGAVAQTGGSGAAAAGAAIGGGIAAAVGGGFAVFMAVVCLIGFAVAYFIGREMHDKTSLPTRKCPECAEMIQADARKCRFCAAVLVPESPVSTAPSARSVSTRQ